MRMSFGLPTATAAPKKIFVHGTSGIGEVDHGLRFELSDMTGA